MLTFIFELWHVMPCKSGAAIFRKCDGINCIHHGGPVAWGRQAVEEAISPKLSCFFLPQNCPSTDQRANFIIFCPLESRFAHTIVLSIDLTVIPEKLEYSSLLLEYWKLKNPVPRMLFSNFSSDNWNWMLVKPICPLR